jgi:hypothetical protein
MTDLHFCGRRPLRFEPVDAGTLSDLFELPSRAVAAGGLRLPRAVPSILGRWQRDRVADRYEIATPANPDQQVRIVSAEGIDVNAVVRGSIRYGDFSRLLKRT